MSADVMLEWLQAPMDPTRAHDLGTYIAWHARLMVLAWALLFPLGITAARFFKIMPGQNWPERLDNKTWWHTHLSLQYVAAAAVLAALWFVWQAPGRGGTLGFHAILGWTVIVFCGTQFLGGWLRGSKGGPTDPAPDGSPSGDHYDMTKRRRIFEHLHKTLGYVAVLMSFAAILDGLWLVNAPRWMWLGLVAWWVCLISVWSILHRRGYAIDTYQAIWGADPNSSRQHARTDRLGRATAR